MIAERVSRPRLDSHLENRRCFLCVAAVRCGFSNVDLDEIVSMSSWKNRPGSLAITSRFLSEKSSATYSLLVLLTALVCATVADSSGSQCLSSHIQAPYLPRTSDGKQSIRPYPENDSRPRSFVSGAVFFPLAGDANLASRHAIPSNRHRPGVRALSPTHESNHSRASHGTSLVDSQIEHHGGSPVGRRVKGFDTLPYPMGDPLLLDEAALSQIP
jgi:hypothetical protein